MTSKIITYRLMLKVEDEYHPVNWYTGTVTNNRYTVFTEEDMADAEKEMIGYQMGDYYWERVQQDFDNVKGHSNE